MEDNNELGKMLKNNDNESDNEDSGDSGSGDDMNSISNNSMVVKKVKRSSDTHFS
jgi:hypothetical protein